LQLSKNCSTANFNTAIIVIIVLKQTHTLGQAGDTTGGLSKNIGAARAHDNGLGVREDGGDLDASLIKKIQHQSIKEGHGSIKHFGGTREQREIL